MAKSKGKMTREEIRERVRKAVKAEDGIIATLISSKFSALLLRVIGPTSITPNQVSVFSLVLSIAAAYLLYLGEYWALVAGAMMIQVHFIFDCLDGELARFQQRTSIYGGWLDQMIDRISEFLFVMGLTWGLYRQTGDWWLWPLGSMAFFSLFMYYFSDAAISPLIRREQEKGRDVEVPVPMAKAEAGMKEDILGNSLVSRMKRVLLKMGVKGSFLSTIMGRDMQLFLLSMAAVTKLTVPLFIFFSTALNGYWILRSYRYWVRRLAG